jgi:hemerythrin superfamily protein
MPQTGARTETRSDAGKRKTSPRAKDAVALLRADHAAVLDLFEKFEKMKSDGPQKAQLVGMICDELTIHTRIEEEIFYPAAREALEDEDLLDEADVEHAGAKELIAQLRQANPGDDHYDAKVTVLGEYIKHHVKEEHSEMFPQCKKADMDLKQLGRQMAERKTQLKQELEGRH